LDRKTQGRIKVTLDRLLSYPQAVDLKRLEDSRNIYVTPEGGRLVDYPGAYILLIFLPERQSIRVGCLGKISFLPGWYAYVGSAMGGLRGRISRHLRQDKKVHWHIDYFLAVGMLKGIITVKCRRKIECLISCCLAEKLPAAADRFGASDCSCKTHLYFASVEKQMRSAVEEMLRKTKVELGCGYWDLGGEKNMSFRFWRRVKIAPGVTLNLSKSGGSLSFGPCGAKFTVGPRGKRATAGIPGTGLFYTTTFSSKKSSDKRSTSCSAPAAPMVRPEDRLSLNFFKRLVTPDDEEALVDGCRELVLGNEEKAIKRLKESVHLADGAYLAGFLALKSDRLDEAADYLAVAAEKHSFLGTYFSKYGIAATISLPITDEVSAHVGPDLQGVLLGLVEVYQRQERWQDAVRCLERLRQLEPDDVVVKLSLAELLLDTRPGDKNVFKEVVQLAEGVENETPVHTALLLYKARALRGLGLLDAARGTLTGALRRKKDRSEELLRALGYERALVYEDLGQHRRARSEFEKLYAEAPDYEDVATRLGL